MMLDATASITYAGRVVSKSAFSNALEVVSR